MKNTLREAVLDFLRNLPKSKSDQFNKAFELYRQTPDRDQHQERTYNSGFSDSSLANLLYDLQKLHKISDVEKRTPVDVPVIELQEELTPEAIEFINSHGREEYDKQKDQRFGTGDPDGDSDLGETEEIKNAEGNLDLQAAAELEVVVTPEVSTASEEKKVIDFTPSPETEERKRLRDEFPFLDDEDCPIELRALVTDKVSAYRKYCVAHNQLQAHQNGTAVITDEAELQNVTKLAVEEFAANRAIYDELNYYKAQGKILGVHPIFQSLTLQREVNSMNKELLEKYVAGAKQFMTTKKGQLTRAVNDPEKTADLNAAIDGFNQKLVLVNRKLETLLGE